MKHTLPSFAAALVFAAFTTPTTPAQGPPVDTSFLKRYAETRGFMLGRPVKPKFSPDGQTVFFLRADPPVPRLKLFAFDVKTAQTKELLSAEMLLKGAEENLTPEEKARRERQRVSIGGFADYLLDSTGNRILVMLSGKPYIFDRTTNKVQELKVGPGSIVDAKWSPDGKHVSYARDYDVYVYDVAADKEIAITTGGTATITHGLAEFVAQEEMDRHSGYWWSPDSKFIAYEEADHTGVEVWYIADPFKPGVAPQPQFYPRPGKKNVSVRLGIVLISGGKTVWVEWDRKQYEYLAAVHWEKNAPLTVLLQDRKQQTVTIARVKTDTGDIQTLHENFWNREYGGWENFNPSVPKWLPSGSGFAWIEGRVSFAQRSQDRRRVTDPYFDQLAIRDSISGKVILDPILDPAADIDDVIAITDKEVIYTIRPESVRTAIVSMPLSESAKPEDRKVLTPPTGLHTAVFDASLTRYALTSTFPDKMPVTTIHDRTTNRIIGELPSTAEEPPFKPNATFSNSTPGVVILPRNFDATKMYPVILDVYGGPHHIHVQEAMRNWLVPQWFADQGFIVLAIDNRGTPGRGRAWERAIYQQFGTVPLEDQAKGVRSLRTANGDLDRVGIVGWSFGGYMAANAVLRRPDEFKAAVAGAPVTDWEDYDTHYTERYLGLLPESRAAYEDASLIPLAKDLKRPLLLVHGTADDNVYYRHTLKLADALFRAGKPFETLPLPGISHMYTADPQVTERLWERNVQFFKKHLGEPEPLGK